MPCVQRSTACVALSRSWRNRLDAQAQHSFSVSHIHRSLIASLAMASGNIGQVVAYSLLTVANLFSSVKITSMTVPELAQTSGVASLACEYSVNDDRFIVQWLLNDELVYEWRPHTVPLVQGAWLGRLDNTTMFDELERRTLRIVEPGPELTGDYTCVVRTDDGLEDRQTKTMLVFSPEHEFVLTIEHKAEVEISCVARGLYPQPHLVLELNRAPLAQEERVWRNGSLYDAATRARLPLAALRGADAVTCRLLLPPAGYAAMREKHLPLDQLKRQKFKYLCSKSNNTKEDFCQLNAASEARYHNIFSIALILFSLKQLLCQ